MNSSLMRPQLQRYKLPDKIEFDQGTKEKISALLGADEHKSGRVRPGPAPPAKKKVADDDDAEEDLESSDSELPEDWMERYDIQDGRKHGSDSESSGDQDKSSDDWSTASLELSEETREGRPEQDPRTRPVDLGPIEADTTAFVDVSGGDGGVLKRVAREGDGPYAVDGFTVDMKYVLLTLDGTVLDVSMNDMWPNKEHKFAVGQGEVIRGMDVVAKNMKRREKARFRIRADYAYGASGCPPKVAPGTEWLVLDAELMGLRRPHRDKLFLRDNEVMSYVMRRKEQGNTFYKNSEYTKAVHEYKSCTKAIVQMVEDTYRVQMRGVATQLLGNLAAAHLALGNYRRTIKYCTQVLTFEPTNDKALYRRAQALRKYPDRLEEARKDMCEAIRVAPTNKQLRQDYQQLLEEVKLKRRTDKLAYGTIFGKEATIYTAKRPRVFLQLAQGKKLVGRLVIELFDDVVPRTAENFRALCVGFPETTKKLHYEGTLLHRVIEDYIVQGGDVTGKVEAVVVLRGVFACSCCSPSRQGGAGGESIYGPSFDDENLTGKIDRAGVVCMANRWPKPNSNNSQFFITLASCPELQGKNVVVGRVVSGKADLLRLSKTSVDDKDAPVVPVKIFKSGMVSAKDPMVDSDSE